MKTTFLLSQHCRCAKLLDLIVQCDRRIASHKHDVEFFDTQVYRPDLVEWYMHRWEITLAAKERLAKAYASTLSKIIKPTVDKILQTV